MKTLKNTAAFSLFVLAFLFAPLNKAAAQDFQTYTSLSQAELSKCIASYHDDYNIIFTPLLVECFEAPGGCDGLLYVVVVDAIPKTNNGNGSAGTPLTYQHIGQVGFRGPGDIIWSVSVCD